MDNEKELKNNDSNIDDIETISFDNVIDDPIISNNQGSLPSFFNEDVQQDANSQISNTEVKNAETHVNQINEDTNSKTITEESSMEQQTEQTLNKEFNESHKTDNASSIIDDIKSANLKTNSKKNSKNKDDQPSGFGFIIILFIVLIIFIFALPYITKLF